MYESQVNRVSKLIHDLHEKVENLEKENVKLKSDMSDIYDNHKSNMELGVDWEYDNDGNHVAYSKDDLNRQITNLRIKQKELEKENNIFKKDNHLFRQENVRLVAQLENDEHNVGHLDENMKRLAYLEKHVAENRYVFTEIPNTPENLKMVKLMKKHINKRKYTLRWRGQYLIDGEDWRKYTYGQPLSKSKCIRVYIDSKAYSVDTVEGFNMSEVKVIMDSLDKQMDVCSSFLLAHDRDDGDQDIVDERNILDQAKQLHSYFESMKLHLENSASTPIKDNVNIVIPKGDKQCHTK